ncbi:MAG: hypothetical protein AMS21_06950 [Gemmatimonas sp. SG8_38_2]|nr:MAG: hypothetical protein AMS21_06950 [Gemmatimonas sp. SG8_38_2]
MLCTLLLFLTAAPAGAQENAASDWSTFAGGALGLYSSGMLALTGSLIPCTQTLAGVKCVRVSAVAGSAIGLVSGLYLGDASEEFVEDRLRGAGYGLIIGSAVGAVLQRVVPHYGFKDILTFGASGAAIGASPKGAIIGFAAGTFTGAVLWQLIPSFEFADGVGMAIAGMAVGGIASWVIDAADAQSNKGSPELVLPVTIRI